MYLAPQTTQTDRQTDTNRNSFENLKIGAITFFGFLEILSYLFSFYCFDIRKYPKNVIFLLWIEYRTNFLPYYLFLHVHLQTWFSEEVFQIISELFQAQNFQESRGSENRFIKKGCTFKQILKKRVKFQRCTVQINFERYKIFNLALFQGLV